MKIVLNKAIIADGFTLIEMILAIGVSAIVLITICTVFFAALHLRDATQDLVDSEIPVDQATATMQRDLECLVTPTNGTTKVMSGDFRIGNISSTGIGQPVSIEMFTATGGVSDSKPWGEIQRVTYELRDPANPSSPGKDLIRTITRNLMPVATPDIEDQWMMGGVQSITFSGYDGTQWWTTWDTTGVTSLNTNLPTAVKVDIQFAGNNNTSPIEIVVPVDSVSRTNRTATTTDTGTTGNTGN
ncbi:MAG TPA: type II secretion system protein GspJ [Verrucomicrobiae bacterium]|jgi:type II secretion system protein J